MNNKQRKEVLLDYMDSKSAYVDFIGRYEDELAESWEGSIDQQEFEKLNLPEKITLYHGCVWGYGNPWFRSYSWTLSHDTALWFANRDYYALEDDLDFDSSMKPMIAKITITRDQILAYCWQLDEQEVLLKQPLVAKTEIEYIEEGK